MSRPVGYTRRRFPLIAESVVSGVAIFCGFHLGWRNELTFTAFLSVRGQKIG
jgi:hypothetical protein